MSKYRVTFSTLFIAGQRYKRGDVVELDDTVANMQGSRLEPFNEPVVEAPKKRTRKAPKIETEAKNG